MLREIASCNAAVIINCLADSGAHARIIKPPSSPTTFLRRTRSHTSFDSNSSRNDSNVCVLNRFGSFPHMPTGWLGSHVTTSFMKSTRGVGASSSRAMATPLLSRDHSHSAIVNRSPSMTPPFANLRVPLHSAHSSRGRSFALSPPDLALPPSSCIIHCGLLKRVFV